MNNVDTLLKKMDNESLYWIKFFKKGKIFARNGKFSTRETDGTFIFITRSIRLTGEKIYSKFPIKPEELIFVGNRKTNEILFADPNHIIFLGEENTNELDGASKTN